MRRRAKTAHDPERYGLVESVALDGIAEEIGIRPGDRIVSINGHVLRDVIDFQFYGADEGLTIATLRDQREIVYEVERDLDEELGIEFAAPTFDGIRRCRCHCSFCFVHQMPPGLRPTLYLRDDDYRYSFLFGNFITLANLDEQDWARLAEQRISPLYVSVHATDPALRASLMGTPQASDVVGQLRRLGELGIEVHTQIVLVPGINDGEALSRTLADLAGLYPTVQSIALVPVGLTRYHREGLRTMAAQDCADLAQAIAPYQASFRASLGIDLVYLADEIYLQANLPIPPAERYDEFAHLENGVGLVRLLLDEWDELRPQVSAAQPSSGRVSVVCGALIAPVLGRILGELAGLTGLDYHLVPVINQFFGPGVTVSGLLTGQDVVAELRRQGIGDRVVLPRIMFDSQGARTLDDLTVEGLQHELGVRVDLASSLNELLALP
ncbi:MAG: DUF512 domain-containing protein [Chloroflexi bacterium]|nr:DUF512 domain-containing protein [Chloroflexota bacterium]